MVISITVNGKSHQVDADPDTPLLWVIRDLVGLTGTKFGCGRGLCGACTVHIDGAPTRSCLTQLSSVEGRQIATIEALSATDSDLVDVWVQENVAQCGYCQPGQLMSAAALLNNNLNPSDAEIDNAMTGNICRCGTYPRIRRAIKSVAEKRS